MGKTQMTNEEMVERFSQMVNRAAAMEYVMKVVQESLEPAYQGLEVRPFYKDSELAWPLTHIRLKGYNLVQRTELDQPRTIQPTGLLGKLRQPVIQTYEEKNIVYGSRTNATLYVHVNDKKILEVCEEVAGITQDNVKVRLNI